VEPEDMLAEYRARVAGIAERAQAARQQIAAVRGTETSSDGAVTVSVNASGALEDLSFGSAADSIPLSELASTILRTSRKARIRAATAGADALVPLIGAESAAMSQVRAAIPDDSSLDEDVDRPTRDGLNEEQESGPVPAPLSRPASTPPRARVVLDDDDDAEPGYTRGD
jgi:YbaB/EbfC DNA-binding family protein